MASDRLWVACSATLRCVECVGTALKDSVTPVSADNVGLAESAGLSWGAFAGVAETGTLIMRSGPNHPTTLNFLPDTHIVVIRKSQVVGTYEDAWDRLREGDMPRTVNLITGASRTGDIEQTIFMGAHGPRRMHIVLVEDD